jgi:hypothetical protein
METNYSSLGNQAFGEDADALIIIKYRSHLGALDFLQSALRQPNGIGHSTRACDAIVARH